MNSPSLQFGNAEEQNTENQDNFVSNRVGMLGIQMETHSGEDLETHSAEQAFTCNQCEFTADQAADLRKHFIRIHSGKNCSNATNAITPLLNPAIGEDI